MKQTIIAACAALALAACTHNAFTIEGSLENGSDKTLWLEELSPEGPLFIDSIHTDSQGHFSYTYKMPYRSFYNLHSTDDNYIVTLPDYGEHIIVNGRWDNLSVSYTVEGSPESMLLWQLQQYTNEGAAVVTALVDTSNRYSALLEAGKVDKATVAAKHRQTDSVFREERNRQREFLHNFLEENTGSLSTLIALYKTYNNRALIDPRDSAGAVYYEMVRDGLQQRYPDNPHTLHFCK